MGDFDDAKISQDDVYSIVKFANYIYNGTAFGYYTPDILNKNLLDLNNNPQTPTKSKAIQALIDYKASQEQLQGYNEFMSVFDMLYKRLEEYYANMLSFDLNIACKNAYSPQTDYASQEYKDDLKRVYKFLDNFNYKEQFRMVVKELLRHDKYYTWFRTSKGTINEDTEDLKTTKSIKYSLQMLPQLYCKLTGRWECGYLFDFDMVYFTRAGVDIRGFDPTFKNYWNDVFDKNKQQYFPSQSLDSRNGSFNLWHQTSPEDGAWCWSFSDNNSASVPFLSSMIPKMLTNDEVAKLQVDKDMISARAILAGEIQTLDKQQSGNSTDAMTYKMDTLLKLLALVKRGLQNNINAVAMPTADPKMWQYTDTNSNMVDNQYKTTISQSASASRLLYANDKLSESEIQNAIVTDYNIMKKLYSQFDNFLNFYVNKKTRKYKFNFMFSGSTYPFIRDKEIDNLLKLSDKGINLAPRTYAKVVGMTPQDFDRLLEEGKYSNWTTELLTQLISINTQSGKDSSTAKEGGRPKIENGDISDGGATSRDYG